MAPPAPASRRSGCTNRSVSQRKLLPPAWPASIAPPKPTTVPSRPIATAVEARSTRCSRYGQPGTSGHPIGSLLASSMAAIAGTSSPVAGRIRMIRS